MSSGHVNTAQTSGVVMLGGLAAAGIVVAVGTKARDALHDPLFWVFVAIAFFAAIVLLGTGGHWLWRSCHKLPVPVSPKHNLQLQQAIRDAISATKNGGQVTHDSNASAAAFRAHFPKVSKRLDNWENSLACIPEAESDANLQIVCSLAWWLRDPVFIWRVVADWLYPEVSNRARKLLDPVTPFLRLLELPRFDGQVDYAA